MEHSESISELVKALGKAQLEIGPIKRTTKNPFFGSMYADLSTVLDAIRKPLADNGLVLIQTSEMKDNQTGVNTMLYHPESKEWLKESFFMMAKDPTNPQILGAINTYLRRYGLPGLFLVASEDDDDGNSAVAKEDKKKEEPPKTETKPATGSGSGMTAGQLKYMQTLFGRAGYKEDLDKHAYATGIVDDVVKSLKDLTFKEASVVIDSLVKLTAQPPTS